MKYLFFDIECANCFGGKGKIYSFGYLITDNNFNIITGPEDILMNPHAKFDPYVKKNILVYDAKMLKTMPDFKERYNQIKDMMCSEDVICLGYGVINNDLRFLSDECKRFKLPKIEVKCFDVQKLIELAENKKARKLAIEFEERFGHQEERAHRSDTDAVRTMLIAKQICENNNKKIEDYIE